MGATGTYTDTLPTDLDKVRYLIQDTNTTDFYFSDNEITAMIGMWGSYNSTAIACCEILASRFIQKAESKTVSKLILNYGNLAKKYAELAKVLRLQLLKFNAGYLGGLTHSDKEANEEDSDICQPAFKRGMMKQKLPDQDEVI